MLIRDVFAREKTTFSFEFFPPKDSIDALALGATLGELKQLKPSFVSVTYGAGGSTQRTTFDVCQYIQSRLAIPSMAHFTCVGATEAQLVEGLEYLKSIGIVNTMLLRGDPPKGQTTFQVTDGGFAYARDLVALARKVGQGTIGVAGYPEKHRDAANAEADIAHLKSKMDAGADFVVTQLFFNNAHYFNYVKRARAAGITARILPGIMPITQFKQIKRMAALSGAELPEALHHKLEAVQDDAPAQARIGIEYAIGQCRELLAGGAPGIHFYTLNKSHATTEIFMALKG